MARNIFCIKICRDIDPACGSGNFLTETYLSLRRLENEIFAMLYGEGQTVMDGLADMHIKVKISQFYGIEINDFAVTVAKTALWIAESQMMARTEEIVGQQFDFLPLTTNASIVEGNALTVDWEEVVPRNELSYIMGNPPFVGGMYMSREQKNDITAVLSDAKGVGEMDYVCGWYKKAADYIKGTFIHAAFVSTNSICQGQQVITFWKYMFEHYTMQIDFAYQTFVWNSESSEKAKVHCIIVGFSCHTDTDKKKLFTDINIYKDCDNISPYLADTPTVFIDSRSTPICDVPPMRFGSMPRDGGGFVLTPEQREELIKKEPLAEKWIRPYIGANEYINNKERYCLWLVGASPAEIRKCPMVLKRIAFVKKFREMSKAAATQKFALTPTLFCQIAQPESDYIIVPNTSSSRRSYIPLGYVSKDVIASNAASFVADVTLYHFGVLTSNVHMAWMRAVAGRLKSDYRYSKDIVYNNFPWPNPTAEQKALIERTAQDILSARAKYPDCSLADLYDELNMPPELRAAHRANDYAVMLAYGFRKDITESECVGELMKMYKEMTENG